MTHGFSDEPISRIEWRDAQMLVANSYNPNMVMSPELRLLERSVLKTGWVQPLLITKDGVLIDGFHRWRLSIESAALRAKYRYMVPCAVLDLSRAEAMLLTVRINRAKGVHGAVKMAELVKELIDVHHMDPSAVAEGIGATMDEVNLLHQEGVFKARNIENWRYSKAWYPREDGRRVG